MSGLFIPAALALWRLMPPEGQPAGPGRMVLCVLLVLFLLGCWADTEAG